MSETKNENPIFILDKIKELEFETRNDTHPIIPEHSIKINENTFAFICYHYVVQWTETKIDFIKFYKCTNDDFRCIGQYNFNDEIIKEPSDFIQMKVENNELIIITKKYLILEKIIINVNGNYFFQNITYKKFDEIPFKILSDKKIVFYKNNNLKICKFSLEQNDIKCLFQYSYDNLATQLDFKKENNDINKENIEEDDDDDEYSINQNGEISNKLCDVIEIKEKNLIIASFSKYHYYGYDDIDYTFSKYIISIIDIKNFQINSNIFNDIEAEKLFYFGNNELYSFGYRKFFKLNLKNLKKETVLYEEEIDTSSHYYHYNIIPFFKYNKLISFGYYRCGYYHNRDEHKHACVINVKDNYLKEANILNRYYNEYGVIYFPIKLYEDRILIIFEYHLGLFKLNNNLEKI